MWAKQTEGEGILKRAVILIVLITTVAALVIVSRTEADEPGVIQISTAVTYTAPNCGVPYRAVVFYRKKTAKHRATLNVSGLPELEQNPSCARLRDRAKYWRHTAAVTGRIVKEHHNYHWNWQQWLPAKWQRIGACETGYGRVPGNWRHSNGSYQGAFGFALSSWDGFVSSADPKAGPYPPEAWQATPRQQYEVALAIYRRYGLSGWGCRGA